MRTLTDSADTLTWVLGDHLGSASITANENGTLNSVIQYTAFGEIRLTQGITPTKYRYTGQLAQAELGLDFYVSRFYDPLTAHFTSADTLIPEPGKSQGFDRYGYSNNNPIKYNDPNGHDAGCSGKDCSLMPYQWVEEIYSLSTSDAEFVANLYSSEKLSGESPIERTETILELTYNDKYQNFAGDYGDSGFANDLQDGNDQVGHFITAVKFGFELGKVDEPIISETSSYLYLSPVIGHEMLGDNLFPDHKLTSIAQAVVGLFPPVHNFFSIGNEESFKQILYTFPFDQIKADRTGNSLADLRLSKIGTVFGKLIRQGKFKSREEVEKYLRRKLEPKLNSSVNEENQ